MQRRHILSLAGASLAITLLPRSLRAATWPERDVTLVVSFAAGGGSDFIARFVSDRLQAKWGRGVIVKNTAGAGGMTGTNEVAGAAGDGYTLLVGANGPLAVFPHLHDDLPYDVADFVPISTLTRQPFLIVANNDVPAATMAEFLAHAKAHPGDLSYGSAGIGTAPHLIIEILQRKAGIEMLHIPYRGSPPALTDLMAGQIQMMVGDPNTLMGAVREGQVKALAVTTAERSPLYPDTPTVAEAGVGAFDFGGWFGILAPKGTPPEVASIVSTAITELLAGEEAQKTLGNLGGRVAGSTPEEFAAFIAEESARWGEAVAEYGLKEVIG